jgi:hypothetical protein
MSRRTVITCDKCENEVTDTSMPSVSMKFNGEHYEYVIDSGASPAGEKPDFCKHCLIDAFNNLYGRPTEGPCNENT